VPPFKSFQSAVLRLLLTLVLAAALSSAVRAEPVLSEFMAANSATLADEDGAFSDWIELHNPDALPVNLEGWSLTDSAANPTKWRFPAVSLPAGGYLVVFASNKDRRAAAGSLHTNFALSAGGEYLALVKPDGTRVTEYAPGFPEQFDDISYGIGPDGSRGYLQKPTPGAVNGPAAPSILRETVQFSQASGPFQNAFSLALSGADAAAGQRIRYAIGTGSGAGTVEPTATSPEYSGPIVISGTAVLRAAVFSADGTIRGRIATAHYLKIGAGVAAFSSRLPVVVIDDLGAGPLVKDGLDHPSWLYAYEADDDSGVFATSPILVTPLEASVRGASSADFPKKSYNIKLRDEQGRDRAAPLFDLPAFEKWAFIAPWSFDHSYINNAFVYSLSNRIGRWAPRTQFVEVFFNADGGDLDASDYAGIYAITDRIEPGSGRVDIPSPSDKDAFAATGGYILKLDVKAADEVGWLTDLPVPSNNVSSVVLVSPKADEITPAQLNYIRTYVQEAEDALQADQAGGFAQRTYLDYIDRASWVDHHLLNTFVCNPDAFSRSAYFHKNRGGKLAAGPVWDFDRALGSFWDERSARWDVWSGVGAPDVWQLDWWGLIARDPEFMQDWIDRWQTLRQSEFSSLNLTALVNALANTIGSDAAHRDAARWPDSASPWGSYPAQIEHVRTWVQQRAGWIDRQFVAPPVTNPDGETLTFIPPSGAELAYTLDGSDPRSLGGEIAPNAILTAGPLTVPASANVHVRSYRAALRGVFPGSPWSSAVGGEDSSPLLPRARLVNISTRAVVGSGENALIAGVVVADTQGKRYLARGVGPGLSAFGASGVVPDPQLSIVSSEGVELFRNNGWENGPDAANIPGFAKSVGAFPLTGGSGDSALAQQMARGTYTLQITTPSGQPGIGLAELYELDGSGRTVNLSTRALVRSGDGVLIGGFVVQGPAYKRMLIRGIGPTLAAFGVGNALTDTVLTIYSGQQIVAMSDRWESSENLPALVAASKTAGAFALAAGSEDAALLITLPPGAYTVEVKGKDGAEGVALLEIYEVP
jgi:hypothetical protein